MNFHGLAPFGATPNERQLMHYGFAKKAFIHFGMNTFTNCEWGNGSEETKNFNPSALDARQWVRSLKACGFELIILTAKHHDGFCLWPTKVSEHSVKNSPYGGDVVKEFTDACREYGVRAGLYLSPWDRNSPYWGDDRYNDYYAAQLTELLTNYGEIYEIWWDGAGSTETTYDWARWAKLIRSLQPNAAIFGSLGASPYVDLHWVGNEQGRCSENHYASIDLEALEAEDTRRLYTGRQGAAHYIPSETDVSIRPGWFYRKEQDEQVKSVCKLNQIWFESVGRNSQLLLNFPPDQRGLLHEKDLANAMESHRRIQRMLAVNYASDAEISADSCLCPACSPDKALLADDRLFYAPEKGAKKAVLELALPKEQRCNTLLLQEVIELGERISAFRLEEITDEGDLLLFEGSSVGHLRACKLPEKAYRRLRLTLEGQAEPALRSLGLHYFEDAEEEAPLSMIGMNLAELSAAKVSLSEDLKEMTVHFGGIYPFNYVRFLMEGAGEYELLCFDGTDFQSVCKGEVEKLSSVKLHLDEMQEGSYQIKIRATAPLSAAAGAQVMIFPGTQKK